MENQGIVSYRREPPFAFGRGPNDRAPESEGRALESKRPRGGQYYMLHRHIHRLFEVSVTLKGLHALLELVTGAAILALSPVAVSNLFVELAQREQAHDAPGFIATALLALASGVQHGGQRFAGFYLLAVGMINLVLVIGLLTSSLWSFPAALAAIASLMAYQLYRYTHTRAIALIFLTAFDAVVWWLVWHEYRILRAGAPVERRSSLRSAV